MTTVGILGGGQLARMMALAEFASRVDVATFDFENVPAE